MSIRIALFIKLSYYTFVMKKNEEYVVTCIDETNQAAGIVKIDDMVVFVPGLLKGEKANIRILKVQKSYAFGKIMQFLETKIIRNGTQPF